MKRIVQLLFPLVLAALALVPGWAHPAAPDALAPLTAAAQEDAVAALEPVQGVVQYQALDADPQDPDAWITLNGVMLVAEGDRIRTDRVGKAFLTFFEGLEIEIGPSTLMVVSTLQLDDLANQNFNISMDVLLGVALTTIDVTLDASDRFEIHTPGATAVVRGTRWWTLVHQDGRSEFEGLEGVFGVVPNPQPPPPGVTPAAPPDGIVPDNLALAWNTWVELQPGDVGAFAPDGEVLEPPPAIALPEPPPAQPLSATCGDGVCQPGEAQTCAIDCLDQLDLSSCGNGLCEADRNEDLVVCPADCSPYPGAMCGNGTCEADESGITCAADCAPDEYFGQRIEGICGNGTCDLTESSLTCPADCKADALDPTQCVLTGDAVNMRTGPGLDFPVAGWLNAGDRLIATGISADGEWFYAGNEGVWVLRGVVQEQGACDSLAPVAQTPTPRPPTQPAAPVVTQPPSGTGQWGACGSCASCGPYPAGECVQAPDGQCVWDPSTCRPQAPPDTGDSGTPTARVPQLVFPPSVSCTSYQTVTITGELLTPDGATIVYFSAMETSSQFDVTGYSYPTPTKVDVQITCYAPGSGTVTATVTDSQSRNLSDSFTVQVN